MAKRTLSPARLNDMLGTSFLPAKAGDKRENVADPNAGITVHKALRTDFALKSCAQCALATLIPYSCPLLLLALSFHSG
jgi:hypothetical protein